MRILSIGLICLLLSVSASAQRGQHKFRQHQAETIKLYTDSLYHLADYYANNWKYEGEDTLTNPYYYPLFFRPTYYNSAVEHILSYKWEPASLDRWHPASLFTDSLVDSARKRNHCIQKALIASYLNYPEYVKGTEAEFRNDEGLRQDLPAPTPHEVKLTEQLPVQQIDLEPGNLDIVVRRPNFWDLSGSSSLQFTQNYISGNWYQGGESNNALLAQINLRANYNNKQKVKFENTLEMKLGFQSSRSDDVHKYKTYSDQIRLTNKLGLQAAKNWYYTLLLQSWTQFYPGYKSNDEKVYSDFFSPFESVISLGMDYKLNLKNFNLSANISPFAYDFKYVDRLALSTKYGLRAGKHSRGDKGSTVTLNSSWQIVKPVRWTSRVYYFTDYTRVTLEWENTIDFSIYKYLSTRLFLFPRFDDNVNRDPGESYIQFKEWLSLGVTYSF